MLRPWMMGCLLVVCMIGAGPARLAWANAAPLELPPPEEVVLRVIGEPEGSTAHLVLPYSGRRRGIVTPTVFTPSRFTGLQTVVVGTALAAALVCAGLWLARRRSRRAGVLGTALLLTTGVLAGTLAVTALADVPLPTEAPSRQARPQLPDGAIPVLVVYERGKDAIELHVSRSQMETLWRAMQKPEGQTGGGDQP